MEMYIHVRDDMNQVLAFNPNTYGKFEPLRDKLKELLLIPKEKRTLQNIQVIMALMRDNASFQDYPVHTQIQLARCMQYQRSINTNPLVKTLYLHGERGIER